jgi:ATP-dependent Clp protease ATP-binding subunit ClpA
LNARLDEQDLHLEIREEALKELIRCGYDPVYGARPLKRIFQKMVEDPLANLLIETDLESGTMLTASLENGDVVIR